MAVHRDHHSSKKHKLQIVIVPEENGTKGFSFTAMRWQLIAAVTGVCLVVALVSISAIVFTPLGRLIPVSDAELAQRYGAELVSLQHRVIKLSEEMLVLRDYNRKLRYTLGDKTDTDSLLGGISERLQSSAPDQASEETAETTAASGVGATTSKERGSRSSSNARRTAAATAEKTEPVPEARSAAAGQNNETADVQMPRSGGIFRAAFPISAPVEGYITRTFQNDKMHFGVDYAGKRGTVITAAADGCIIFSNWTQDDGNIIILSHGGGYVTVYQHNQMLLKQQGDFVKRGTPIALLGDSGTTSSGPHLHFEIWKDGQPQNPSEYLIASEK